MLSFQDGLALPPHLQYFCTFFHNDDALLPVSEDREVQVKHEFDGGAQRANEALFEQISIAGSETFIWRLDDYPWLRMVWNYHPQTEIHLIRKTTGIAFIGDHIGEFEPGYLVVVGGGLPHDWVTPRASLDEIIPERDIVLQFSEESLLGCMDFLPELRQLQPFFERSARGIQYWGATRAHAADLLEKIGGLRGTARLGAFLELLGLLAQSSEFTLLSSVKFIGVTNPADMEVLQKVLQYARRHAHEGLLQSDAAKFAGMTEVTFSRFFKKHSGNTFSEHLAELRLWRARSLLSETDLPITSICFEAGYRNVANFNRRFKDRHGMTPSRFRKYASQKKLTL